MINAGSTREIFDTYKKHGWILRRVLLSPDNTGIADSLAVDMAGAAIFPDSELDAAWFSRPPKTGSVAWEIRYLGSIPFALVQAFDESSADFEASLHEVELRLMATIASKKMA